MSKDCANGCDRPPIARGVCGTCYARWRRSGKSGVAIGDLMDRCTRTDTLTAGSVDQFMARVDKSGPRGCWLWTRSRDNWGYGTLTWMGRRTGAHRISYEIHIGPLDPDAVVRHSCDNPPCVNPAHLQSGTTADNIDDMHRRGRANTERRWRGEQHHNAKLTAKAVVEIHALHSEGHKIATIARLYGVSWAAVDNVLRGQSWREAGGFVGPMPVPGDRPRKPALRAKTKPVGCKDTDCDGAHYARGWCHKHYQRRKAHGDLL